MPPRSVSLVCSLLLSVHGLPAAEPFPFTVAALASPATGNSAIDLSHLNAEPAGSHGFLRCLGGRFVDDRGERIRLFGTNLTDFHTMPDAATAVAVARRLRQLGLNAVRLHYADWAAAPDGLTASPGSDDLDPGPLDRLHRFIAELVAQGIWVDLNLHVARRYAQAPAWADMGKGIDRVVPQLLDSQRRYARNLLDPVNPYTGRRLADEPGLGALELNNENTVLRLPLRRLAELPVEMREPLRLAWNRWLVQRHGDTAGLRAAWYPVAGDDRERLPGAELASSLRVEGGRILPLTDGPDGARWICPQPGAQPWSLQLHRPDLAVVDGARYALRLRLRGDRTGSLLVKVMHQQAPWSVVWSQTVAFTPEWNELRLTLPIDHPDGVPLRLSFDLENRPATIDLAGLSLREASEGPALADGALESRQVPLPGPDDSPRRIRSMMEFLAAAETAASVELKHFLREELGCRQPIIDTQIDYGGGAGVARSLAVDDYTDIHGYPACPRELGRDARGELIWGIPDTNLFDRPGRDLEAFAFVRLAGRPFVVSEWDVNPPNQGAGVGLPALVAMASLQDWDGLYDYCWLGWSPKDWNPDHLVHPFTTVGHAPQMVSLPAAAVAFRSGLIEACREVVGIPFTTRHQTPMAGLMDGSYTFTQGAVAPDTAWRHRVELRPTDAAEPAAARSAQDTTTSDTGQVRLRRLGAGSDLRVIAPGLRWLAGAVGGQEHALGDVVVDCRELHEPTATITCTALDGRAIADSRQVLITTTAGAANTGLKRDGDGRITYFGTGPALNQPVPVILRLPGTGWSLHALDGDGVATTAIAAAADGWHLGTQRTLWYLARRER